MMQRYGRHIVMGILTLGMLMSGCQRELKDMKAVYGWINAPEHGMVKTKTVEGIKLTVKYLPAEYLALKETKEDQAGRQTYDSLLKVYKGSHTFLLSIASSEDEVNNDPMYQGLEDYSAYKRRALTMNFDMNEYVSIKTSTQEFRPVLTSMENTYSLKGQRNIYMVFTDTATDTELMNEKELDLVFNDEIFETGINHFVFEQSDLQSIPAINFENIN
jgi:hypothetical protein